MLVKLQGIVLHHINYSETSLILHLYTDVKGRLAVIIPGARGKRKNKKISLYHNLSLLELEVYYKESRELHQIKEAKPVTPLSGLTSDPVKSTVALFISEVLYRCLKEEETNPDLFAFLENSLRYFEMSDGKTANFHIYLLLHLSRFLGFFPVQNHSEENEWFDLRNAHFKSFPPASERLEPELASLLRFFMESNLQSACEFSITRIQRNKLLEALLEYYSIHLPGMGEIKSYGILKEIFE